VAFFIVPKSKIKYEGEVVFMKYNPEENEKRFDEFDKKYRKDIAVTQEYITQQFGLKTEITTKSQSGYTFETFFNIRIYLNDYHWKYIEINSTFVENRMSEGNTFIQALIKEIIFKLTFESEFVYEREATGVQKSIIDLINNSNGDLFGNDIYLNYDGQIFCACEELYLSEINGFIMTDNQAVFYTHEGRYIFNSEGVEFIFEEDMDNE
jgi:hypothetical protein